MLVAVHDVTRGGSVEVVEVIERRRVIFLHCEEVSAGALSLSLALFLSLSKQERRKGKHGINDGTVGRIIHPLRIYLLRRRAWHANKHKITLP